MKDHMRKFVLALALLSSTSAAFAQQQQAQQPQRSGTPEEQAACNRDVQRHCRSVIDQGDFTILACLKENRPKISAACNQVLKNHGQ
jgi:Ni/Co efflux regulator RcnB